MCGEKKLKHSFPGLFLLGLCLGLGTIASSCNPLGSKVHDSKAESDFHPEADPLTAPSSLQVSFVSTTQNNLTWVDQTSDETSYAIERSIVSGSAFTQIGTALANATSYSDSTVSAGILYYYRIRALKGSVVSAYTSQASLVAPSISSTFYTAGISSGGNTVTVSGTGFNAGSKIKINSGSLITPSSATSTQLTFNTPSAASVGASSIARVDLQVVNADSQSNTKTNAFTFVGSPRLWLSSDVGVLNAGGTAAANGDRVATWTDQSGNGRSALQTTDADRPIFATSQFNGKPALTFDGSVSWMNLGTTSGNILNGLSALTAFSAHAFANTTGKGERVFQISTGASVSSTRFSISKASVSGNYNIAFRDGTDAAGLLTNVTTGTNDTNIHVNSVTLDFGASNPRYRSYFDGSVSNTQNTTNTTSFDATDSLSVALGRLGTFPNATFAYEGRLAEILFFGSALSLTDRQTIDDYLMDKYGI